MSLTFIYGKAGSGKTDFCFSDIAKKIKNEKIFIITPEQFSFTAEKKLLDNLGSAVINAEVLTFKRMAYRIIAEFTGRTKTTLTPIGKDMLIYDIMDKNKSDLKFLGKSNKNVEIVSNLLTEFKKHKIEKMKLNDSINSINDRYLQTKLSDINLIYEQFENRIRDKFLEENDLLTILSDNLYRTNMFDNSLIYIDEFSGFTKQEYDILEQLLKVCKNMYVTICTDNLELTEDICNDIYYPNKVTYSNLNELAQRNNIQIAQKNLNILYRFKALELQHLEGNIYGSNYKIYNEQVNNIKLFLANNPYSEVENIANNIIKLVRDEGYRYTDISIITKNLEVYANLIKAIFRKYEIPVFIDEKKSLNENIFVKYILSILEIFSSNWSYESMFNYIKLGLLEIDEDDIFKLENYCLKLGIKGNRWYKKDWYIGEEDELKYLNNLRLKIITPLLKFKENFVGTKDAKLISKSLYEFLIQNQIDKKLDKKIEELNKIGQLELANQYIASWSVILNILDEIVLIFDNEKMTFEKYIEILKIGLTNSELGKIPINYDQVTVGNIDRSRTHKVKAVFIIGINDGTYPNRNNDEGFLSDNDREYLKENKIELAKTTLELLYDDNFNIYRAFCTAENKLFLSYVSSDNEGKGQKPSILISKIKKIFINIKEESDIIRKSDDITTSNVTFEKLLSKLNEFKENKNISEIWINIYDYYNNSKLWKDKLVDNLQALNYTNLPNKLSPKTVDNLYTNTLQTSVSKLEQYQSCPFSFYLKYGLHLSEKNSLKMEAIDTGSFMHEVIDEFFEKIDEQKINIKEIEDKQTNEIIEDIINQKLKLSKNYVFTSSKKFISLTLKLKKVIQKSIKYIIESLKVSTFKVLDTEAEFKQGAEFEPIKVELDKNKKVIITGKIDRIDIADNKEERYIRIVDYKSSSKKIDLNEMYSGIQIQLITYLDAVTKSKEAVPAGMLYFNLIDPIIKSNKNLTDEQLEDEIRKQFKMQGLILADVNIIKMMDNTLNSGTSKVIPVTLDTSGDIVSSKSNTLTKKEFESLQKYVKKLIKQIGEEVLNGDISIKPYSKNKNTPCRYCSFKSICQFSTSLCNNEYAYITEYKKEEVLKLIE